MCYEDFQHYSKEFSEASSKDRLLRFGNKELVLELFQTLKPCYPSMEYFEYGLMQFVTFGKKSRKALAKIMIETKDSLNSNLSRVEEILFFLGGKE